ncbi:MAG: formylmethanofuran--tetrahydromethanopterin N-formyltransferase [Planctomycetota bacterium]|nr:formylmethanofuran--tetrahydromethanopterin N-formyltransferase [Planctomycetota bacterium]
MQIGSTRIVDTFAEAFDMTFARVVVTAADEYWLQAAVNEFCGYGASVIGCDAEVAVDTFLNSSETVDGRIGAAILIFGLGSVSLGKALTTRVGQCLMTCPSTAVYDGSEAGKKRIPLGKHIRFFGDTFQKSKQLDGKRYWRIPVMDGEFVVQDLVHVRDGIGGGNFIIQTRDQATGLAAARRAGEVIRNSPNVISPFAGGVVRSGSKVGSRYKTLRASTADAYCPTLRGRVESKLEEGVNCSYEIVIDGVDFESIANAMRCGIRAAAGEGVIAISAGNYGGKLGKHHFHLRELKPDAPQQQTS